jgi:hypothetical protein
MHNIQQTFGNLHILNITQVDGKWSLVTYIQHGLGGPTFSLAWPRLYFPHLEACMQPEMPFPSSLCHLAFTLSWLDCSKWM